MAYQPEAPAAAAGQNPGVLGSAALRKTHILYYCDTAHAVSGASKDIQIRGALLGLRPTAVEIPHSQSSHFSYFSPATPPTTTDLSGYTL